MLQKAFHDGATNCSTPLYKDGVFDQEYLTKMRYPPDKTHFLASLLVCSYSSFSSLMTKAATKGLVWMFQIEDEPAIVMGK